ncbi:hypothetical protein GCM10009120_39570 [Sphingobacterium siyangense subsp. cladoniae]
MVMLPILAFTPCDTVETEQHRMTNSFGIPKLAVLNWLFPNLDGAYFCYDLDKKKLL